jgi:acyl-coenzyme A thioesterase PaaI-like protein
MKKLPNASHCFGCGMENAFSLRMCFYIDDNKQVVSDTTISDAYQGYPGVVHGGVVAAMLDETAARSVMVTDPNRMMFTGKLTTRYRKPVPVNAPLHLVGEMVRDRGRMAECRSWLYGPDGEVLAEAEALMLAMPDGQMDMTGEEAGMTWKVYPDEPAGLE